jgi:hypothetical protein
MIKFFRRIRQNLISKGKTAKYFKYAFGEILLVVIGILIALQINNLNEQHKANKQEMLLIKQLQLDINTTLNEFDDLKKRLNINKQGIDSLLWRINQKDYGAMVPIYLAQTLRKSDFNYASSGYNLMQNGRATLISDVTILKAVLDIYENELPAIIGRQDEVNENIDFIQRQFINKLFTKSPNQLNIQFKELDVVATDLFEPIDRNSLLENTEFKNTLYQLENFIEARLVYVSNAEKKLTDTLTLLDAKIALD